MCTRLGCRASVWSPTRRCCPRPRHPRPWAAWLCSCTPATSDAATLAAVTTARVAGARVIAVRGADPRADPAAIAALSAARPRQVLAIGTGFGSAGQLASRVAVAQTGVQLPGGGQILFPGRLLVALYGHPGCSGARRPRSARPVGQHRAGQEGRRGLPGPEQRPGHTGPGDHRHRRPGARRAGTATTPTSPAWPSCAPGYAGRRPPECTSSWTCSPAGPACSPRPGVTGRCSNCPMSGWPWTRSGN